MRHVKAFAGPVVAAFGVFLATCQGTVGGELIGHWTFDNPTANTAADASGAGHDGKVHGALACEGIVGGALSFDGADDCVQLGDFGELESATIAFWMKADNVADPRGWQGLVTSDAWEEGVLHVPLGRGVVEVHLHMGESRRARLGSSRLKSGTWYHVAVVADRKQGEIRLYTNGAEEDVDDVGPLATGIKLLGQVVGREFDGNKPSRYFRGAIDDVRIYDRALDIEEIQALCPDVVGPSAHDPRNLRTGRRIPDEGYCDQPYTVITNDGAWLTTLTTGPGREGDHGQHIVATITTDHGATWSEPVDIEPSDGPEASWVMPLVTPGGRVYGFYTYNGENLRTWKGEPIRTDTVGWYCYKYSDDHGRTWSNERYRLPLPPAPVDRTNTFGGEHQIFWGIGKPVTHGGTAWFAFSRCGALVVEKSEGWFYRSDNVLAEPDPEKIAWELLPDGEHGLKNLDFGDVHAEQNLVALSDGSLYCMYRTLTGYAFHAYSRDGGHTWTKPIHATYTPGGRKMKTPRACPRIWRCNNGNFLFWYHNHGDKSGGGWTARNPVWISGGVQRDGFIHWSQPEILLYDPDVSKKISYPDLIEQDGRYWITETQKTIARVHEIDKNLLEGLWSQGETNSGTVPIFPQGKWDCPPPTGEV
ncbi:MAG: LamG-like jellyroll fold domain-containing protein, partial [Planctomycetota bacterium]